MLLVAGYSQLPSDHDSGVSFFCLNIFAWVVHNAAWLRLIQQQPLPRLLDFLLPEQLSLEELKKLVEASIKKVNAKEIKDMGKIMADLMPQVKGKAEGSEISKIIKELLSK